MLSAIAMLRERILTFRVIIFLTWRCFVEANVHDEPPKLLLISIDGLRYDFITPQLTPTLFMLSREGVFFDRGLKVQVHTVTASNHYSISTGLYEESHGIIDNMFWDPVFKDTYDLWNFSGNKTLFERSKLPFWYEGTTPIWQTNEEEKYSTSSSEQNKRRSGSFYWPMGDCFINNKTISKNLTWLDYGNEMIWKGEVDNMIGWLTDEKKPVNFLLYYNAQPDHAEHGHDVYGEDVDAVLKEIDATVAYLIDRLRAVSLWDKINIILTADHGHTNVLDFDHIIQVKDYLNYSQIILNGRSIFPKPGSGVTAEEIYQNLSRAKIERKYPMQVWRKEDFPLHYHYTKSRRIGPVIVYEDLNYQLLFYGSPENYTREKSMPFSTHGWLNDYAEMRAFFVAYGPAFKSKLFVHGKEEIENVDLYPLMCEILGIDPLPNNGSLDRIKFILRDDANSTSGSSFFTPLVTFSKSGKYIIIGLTVLPAACLSLLGVIFLVISCQRKRLRPKRDVESSFEYRRLRSASPESCLDKGATRPKRADALGGQAAGRARARSNGSDAASRQTTGSAGPHRLVPLSDEERSSDENEL